MALREVTEGEMTILATPVATATQMFGEDPKIALLAVFTLGLDIARIDPVLGGRMSEIGQAILTDGGTMDEETLHEVVALLNLMFVVEDLKNGA